MCVGVLHPCRRVYGERTTDAGQLHSCLRWITAAPYEMAITEDTVPELLENTAAQCRALKDLIAQLQAQLPGVPLQVQYRGQTVPASGALWEINAQVGVTIEDLADTYGVGLNHPAVAEPDAGLQLVADHLENLHHPLDRIAAELEQSDPNWNRSTRRARSEIDRLIHLERSGAIDPPDYRPDWKCAPRNCGDPDHAARLSFRRALALGFPPGMGPADA